MCPGTGAGNGWIAWVGAASCRGNRFERLTGDAIQMDGTGVLIEGNTFDRIQVRPGCSAHTDAVQSLGAEDVTIRGDVARDNDSGILKSSATASTRS